jgi:hypothetical protein
LLSRDDAVFAERVRAAISIRGTSIEDIERLLRLRYPKARLVARTEMAELIPEPGTVTWYAFRDGRVVP